MSAAKSEPPYLAIKCFSQAAEFSRRALSVPAQLCAFLKYCSISQFFKKLIIKCKLQTYGVLYSKQKGKGNRLCMKVADGTMSPFIATQQIRRANKKKSIVFFISSVYVTY